jgi:ribose 5-phosphate isomerase A
MVNLSLDKKIHAKALAGQKAAEFVLPGMQIGLGTGSTAFYFIERLGLRCSEGLQIQAFTTSERSTLQAREAKIPLGDINEITALDLTVDGADEIDPHKRMVKGGGGALLREKIVASMSREMIIVVDESKLVKHLGAFPLPVELVPFAYRRTIFRLNSLGYHGVLRQSKQTLYLTDNGNYIYDIQLGYPCLDPEKEHEKIRSIPGVVETGFFFNLAGRVLIGRENGIVEEL